MQPLDCLRYLSCILFQFALLLSTMLLTLTLRFIDRAFVSSGVKHHCTENLDPLLATAMFHRFPVNSAITVDITHRSSQASNLSL